MRRHLPEGLASLLATVLTVSERPPTLLLEELANTEIYIKVLSRTDRGLTASEHDRLDAGQITSGHCRAGILHTKSGIVAAETDLVILRQRLPTDTFVALADTCIPVDKILAPFGMRRLDRLLRSSVTHCYAKRSDHGAAVTRYAPARNSLSAGQGSFCGCYAVS